MTTERRDLSLQRAVRLSAWWLALQALVLLFSGERLAGWLDLRWMPVMAPYVRLAGLSLLALALFVHRGVDQPRRQSLAVDALLLLFLGQAGLTLSDQVAGRLVTHFEWACAAMDGGLSVALLLLRTTSKQRQGSGALQQADARQLAREAALWIAGKGPKPEAGLGSLDDVSPPAWELPSDGRPPLMPKPSGDALAPPMPPLTGAAAMGIPAMNAGPQRKAPPLMSNEALLALPLEKERERKAPIVPPAPTADRPQPVTVPPPSPGMKPRSEPIPRLD